MSIGLSRSAIITLVENELAGSNINQSDIKLIAEALARVITRNNDEINRQLNNIKNLIKY